MFSTHFFSMWLLLHHRGTHCQPDPCFEKNIYISIWIVSKYPYLISLLFGLKEIIWFDLWHSWIFIKLDVHKVWYSWIFIVDFLIDFVSLWIGWNLLNWSLFHLATEASLGHASPTRPLFWKCDLPICLDWFNVSLNAFFSFWILRNILNWCLSYWGF